MAFQRGVELSEPDSHQLLDEIVVAVHGCVPDPRWTATKYAAITSEVRAGVATAAGERGVS
jgi:hypothetical protein